METLTYLGKVSVGLIALYALYWLALRWHTYFHFNRFYLLVATALSLVIPFITFTEVVPAPEVVVSDQPFEMPMVETPLPEPSIFTPENILLWVYIIGVVVMAIRLLRRVNQIMGFIRACEQTQANGYTLAYSYDTSVSSFSFLNYLVINPEDLKLLQNKGSEDIPVISHELVHIRQRHSWDLLWIEVLQVAFWFNPVLIFYNRSLKTIHEFIADDLATNGNRLQYARALAGYALGVSPQVLTNNFCDISQLKQRIAMLTKNRSSRRVLGRYLFAIPILGVMIGLLATRQIVFEEKNTKEEIVVSGLVKNIKNQPIIGVNVKVKGIEKGTTTDRNGKYIIKLHKNDVLEFWSMGYARKEIIADKPQIDVVMQRATELDEIVVTSYKQDSSIPPTPPPPTVKSEEANMESPQFPGGENELYRYLAKNIKYPPAARKANVQGTVIVEFVVNNEGYIESPRLVNKIDFGCDEEALRLVLNMPRWTPAKINGNPINHSYYLPIRFVLDSPMPYIKNLPTITVKDGEGIVTSPIYILDGKEVASEETINFAPENIKSINVVKGQEAIKRYGDRGKGGIVYINSKNPAQSWGIERKEEHTRLMDIHGEKVKVVVREGKIVANLNGKDLEGNPLFVVNGKEGSAIEAYDMLKDSQWNNYSFYVTKDQSYVKSLGDKAKDGVVVINTKKPKTENTAVKSDSIYQVVQIQPMFPGGHDAMYAHIEKNLIYPEPAKRANVEGKVFLTFTVKKDGKIGDVQVLKGMGFGCDEEAVRVALSMPAWTPGKHNGEAVNVRYNLPITFKLSNAKSKSSESSPVKRRIRRGNKVTSITYDGRVIEEEKKDGKVNLFSTGTEPLYIVNGKEISKEKIQEINPTDIKVLTVIKDKYAIDKYGEKGKSGVVEIAMKKK